MNKVAVIGAGMSKFGDRMDKDAKGLFLEAFNEAVSTVVHGISLNDIQAAYIGNQGVGGSQLAVIAAQMVEAVGLKGIPAVRVENACASGTFAFIQAAMAVAAGYFDVVIAGGVEKMREISGKEVRRWMGVAGDNDWERLAGITFPGAYAMAARRHMLDYGTTREQLSLVAVKNHDNGALNPKAQFQSKITLEKAMKSPYVAAPLNVFDCCPTTDGAAVVILCRADLASKYTDKPVELIGFGMGCDTISISNRKTITSLSATVKAARMAYSMAGITPQEVSFAEVHDCFTIAEILAYEDLGFCDRGAGGNMIAQGVTRLDGSKPVNPSGGLKSKGHPIGATGCAQIYEVFTQMREQVSNPLRQVADTKIGLTHNVGGFGGSTAICLFRRLK